MPTSEPLEHRLNDTGFLPAAAGTYCDRCGQPIGEGEMLPEFGCGSCQGQRLPWDGLVTLGGYEHELKEWIGDAKFARHHRLAFDLGRLLGCSIKASGLLNPEHTCLVVPMPTTRRRRFALGIDHAGMLAKGVARALEAPVMGVLRRAHRPSQRSMPASQRSRNVSNSIRLKGDGKPVSGRQVVLIDDVLTTGATMRAAARAIRRGNPSSLSVGVVAATRDPGRRDSLNSPQECG